MQFEISADGKLYKPLHASRNSTLKWNWCQICGRELWKDMVSSKKGKTEIFRKFESFSLSMFEARAIWSMHYEKTGVTRHAVWQTRKLCADEVEQHGRRCTCCLEEERERGCAKLLWLVPKDMNDAIITWLRICSEDRWMQIKNGLGMRGRVGV